MGLLTTTFATNPLLLEANLVNANRELAGADAADIVAWGLAQARRPVVSTNFRPGAAALLHLVVTARPDIPVVWVDTGYNTPATYRYVAALRERWGLNLHCYTPRLTTARWQAVHGRLPRPGETNFARFTREFKLEPFERAFNELVPDVWFTGIRAEQTSYRAELATVSRGARNTLRIAPLHGWSSADVAAYLATHGIADNDDYVDPTKPAAHLECGLQRLA